MFGWFSGGSDDVESVLRCLRSDPRSAHISNVFVAPNTELPPRGCRGDVSLECLGKNVYQIKFAASGEGGDFFFPYTDRLNPAGMVEVPCRCPDGTIVVTPAMNGCALEVIYDKTNSVLKFIHDNNCKQLEEHGRPRGEFIFRAEPTDYMPNESGLLKEAVACNTKTTGGQFGAALVCVKDSKAMLEWGVWSTLSIGATSNKGSVKYSVSAFNRVDGCGYLGGFTERSV